MEARSRQGFFAQPSSVSQRQDPHSYFRSLGIGTHAGSASLRATEALRVEKVALAPAREKQLEPKSPSSSAEVVSSRARHQAVEKAAVDQAVLTDKLEADVLRPLQNDVLENVAASGPSPRADVLEVRIARFRADVQKLMQGQQQLAETLAKTSKPNLENEVGRPPLSVGNEMAKPPADMPATAWALKSLEAEMARSVVLNVSNNNQAKEPATSTRDRANSGDTDMFVEHAFAFSAETGGSDAKLTDLSATQKIMSNVMQKRFSPRGELEVDICVESAFSSSSPERRAPQDNVPVDVEGAFGWVHLELQSSSRVLLQSNSKCDAAATIEAMPTSPGSDNLDVEGAFGWAAPTAKGLGFLKPAAGATLARAAASATHPSAIGSLPASSSSAARPVTLGARSIHEAQQAGDKLQVFSQSDGRWYDGAVDFIADGECVQDGCKIPPGYVKVVYDMVSNPRFKWIPPEELTSKLRWMPDTVTGSEAAYPVLDEASMMPQGLDAAAVERMFFSKRQLPPAAKRASATSWPNGNPHAHGSNVAAAQMIPQQSPLAVRRSLSNAYPAAQAPIPPFLPSAMRSMGTSPVFGVQRIQ